MKNSILNLEGVQVLSRNEQKNVSGGRRCEITDDYEVIYQPGTTVGPNAGAPVAVAVTCRYTCTNTFLGFSVGSSYDVWGGC